MIWVRKMCDMWDTRGDVKWISKPRHADLVFLQMYVHGKYVYRGTSDICDFIPVQTNFNRELDIGEKVITLLGGKIETIIYNDTGSLSDILNEVKTYYAQ